MGAVLALLGSRWTWYALAVSLIVGCTLFYGSSRYDAGEADGDAKATVRFGKERTKLLDEKAAELSAAAAETQRVHDEDNRRLLALVKVVDDAKKRNEDLVVAIAHERSAHDSVSNAAAALAARTCSGASPGDPGTAGGSNVATTATGTVVLADVLRLADDAAGRLAAEAERRGNGWDACSRSYEALKASAAASAAQ